jgi:uncharacterized protein (DUF952 family)/GNAT superfamily N-acetyltransferase
MNYQVIGYEEKYKRAITDLILPIQQQEFNVPIAIEDQPDLQNIPSFYLKGNGNFWMAIKDGEVVGTIALVDIGNNQVALRKMFVHTQHRGKDKGVAQLLFDGLIDWCLQRNVKDVLLGTVDTMLAAHRFYTKNGFIQVSKEGLPSNFPIMRVDNIVTSAWWSKQSQSNSYESETLHQEGFIHCSTKDQVTGVLERYYANQKDLLLLHINSFLLKPALKFELATNNELFPHVFGEINKEAIIKIEKIV